MTEKEYIVLLGFDTVQDGIDYMQSSPYNFAFSVGGSTYDHDGNSISTPADSSVVNNGEMWVCNCENPIPGSPYINGGFLKYYKEIA
tara:strand:+ start:942 stop:1202 length:261 start_codon:yes stop_codon:yes gene_type:complete